MGFEKTGEKFRNWLKDPYNLALFLLVMAFVLFRLYWFFSTLSQPLWWDEAYYMNNARAWLGKVEWKIDAHRPILFPLILMVFSLTGFEEFLARLFVLFCSIISIPLLYEVGKIFFNKKIALISSFILGVFWSFSFYSHRILVDVPIVAFWLATIYIFFNAYFKDKNWKYFALAGIFLGLTFLLKFSAIVLVFSFAFYLLTTEKFKVFFNKKIITFFLLSLLIVLPFFIYQYSAFGSPIFFATYVSSTRSVAAHTFTESLVDQAVFAFKQFYSVFLIASILGLLLALAYVFLLGKKIWHKKSTANRYYFILLWLILSLALFGYMRYEGDLDERYYYIYYPVLFLFTGNATSFVYNIVKKYNKPIGVVCILALLGFGAYQNINHGNQVLDVKKDSFIQFKQAGTWMKERTDKEDMIFLIEEPAEIVYYTERNYFYIYNETPDTLLEKLDEYKPKYLILSFYHSLGDEKRVELVKYVLSNKDIFIPVQSYGPYIDEKQTLPLAVIFEVKNQQ